MIRFVIIFITVSVAFNSCDAQTDCKSLADYTLEKIASEDIDPMSFSGFTIESDPLDGELRRPIQFTTKDKTRINIRFDKDSFGNKVAEELLEPEMLSLLSQSLSLPSDSTKSYIEGLVRKFKSLHILSIKSSRHIKGAVELVLYEGCSIWYIDSYDSINPYLKKYLNDFTNKEGKWYIPIAPND